MVADQLVPEGVDVTGVGFREVGDYVLDCFSQHGFDDREVPVVAGEDRDERHVDVGGEGSLVDLVGELD